MELRNLVNRHLALMYTLKEAHLRAPDQSEGVIHKRQLLTSNSAFYTVVRLNFQFGRTAYKTEAELVASQDVNKWLSFLLSFMRQIRQIYRKGVLYQDILGLITDCDSLKRLVFRKGARS